MSIGIYVFLRIYFLAFGLSAFAQFRTHSTPSSARRRYDLPGVVCLASGTACAAACCVPSFRVRWGRGLHLWGIWGAPRVGWSTPRVEKIQKRRFPRLPTPSFLHKTPPTPIVNLKNFPQKQKDPYKGSVFCAILALQALKGRNL